MDKNENEVEEEIIDNVEQVIEEEQKELSKDEIIEKLKSDLEEQKAKTDEYFEHLKRNMAEFDNYKKRISKDGLYKTVVSDIASSLLPILDNFEKAISSECQDEKYKDGMKMIYEQMAEFLKNQGLEEIEDLGKTFDPNLHEAVMHEENEKAGEKEITEVFRKGYKIGEKVIRHSMVKVAN